MCEKGGRRERNEEERELISEKVRKRKITKDLHEQEERS